MPILLAGRSAHRRSFFTIRFRIPAGDQFWFDPADSPLSLRLLRNDARLLTHTRDGFYLLLGGYDEPRTTMSTCRTIECPILK